MRAVLILAYVLSSSGLVIIPRLGYSQAMGYGQSLGNRVTRNQRIGSTDQAHSFDPLQTRSGVSAGNTGNAQSGSTLTQAGSNIADGGSYYQVHVLGRVAQPGTYQVPVSTRLDSALNMAGGVESQGAQRSIQIRRDNDVQVYDLFRFRRYGQLRQNPFLLDNDTIFVPYAERVVSIQGPVRSPGIYEIGKRQSSLWDLLQLAGGYTSGMSYASPVTIIRYVDGAKQLIAVASNKTAMKEALILHGDTVVMPHVMMKGVRFDYNLSTLPADNIFYPSFNNQVFVMGAVELPGAYPFSVHYAVRDYVSMAGPVKYARLHDVYYVSPNGRRHRVSESYRVSPGDTIVVPLRSFTADNVIKWYNVITNSILTGVAIERAFR